MTSIRELAGIFHPGMREKRNLLLFHFYCDESYDNDAGNPKYFSISGFFSDQPTWEEVERDWRAINEAEGLLCGFHATELNGRGPKTRYAGWDKPRGDAYSAKLLNCVNRQKRRMRAYNCGIRVDCYGDIISDDGRKKLGHPWMVCFKSMIAMVAKDMETLPREDSFSVIFEHENQFDLMAIEAFWEMKANAMFPYRHRLMIATPGDKEEIPCLQVADLMAYEYFKRMQGIDKGNDMRKPLELIRKHNDYCEGYFGESTLRNLKDGIESSVCGPNRLTVIPDLTGEGI